MAAEDVEFSGLKGPLSWDSRTDVLSRVRLLSVLANLRPCITRGSLLAESLPSGEGAAWMCCLLSRLPPHCPTASSPLAKGQGVLSCSRGSFLSVRTSQGPRARSCPMHAAVLCLSQPHCALSSRPPRQMKSHCLSDHPRLPRLAQLRPTAWQDAVLTPTGSQASGPSCLSFPPGNTWSPVLSGRGFRV